jgi:hypothetical protein
MYSVLGAGDSVDSVVSIGGHAYRQDIRRASFRFLNTYLKNDPRPVLDSEVDLVTSAPNEVHPIPPESLRVFPQDADFPKDAINDRIDREFVPLGEPGLPKKGAFESWKTDLLTKLRRVTFHHFPEKIPAAVPFETNASGAIRLHTEDAISIPVKSIQVTAAKPRRIWLVVANSGLDDAPPGWLKSCATDQDSIYACEPRGLGSSRWTTKNPPNYVERSHYLLGRTIDSGRVWDIAATATYLKSLSLGDAEVYLAGEGPAAVLAVYAALLEPQIGGLALSGPPVTHMDTKAPVLLNVLRVCDVPDAIGMLAPRPVTLVSTANEVTEKVTAVYGRAAAAEKLTIQR